MQRSVGRRLFALFIVALVGLLALSGAVTNVRAQQKTVLTFWNGFTGPDRPAVEELVKRYNETNTDNVEIQMEIIPWDSLLQKLLSTMSTGQGPDLAGFNFNYVPQYAKSGYILDLTEYMVAGTDLDPANWPPALVERLKYEGKFYAAPMNFATLMMYYNKDLFQAAGLDPDKPPADWDSWIAAIRKLTDPSKGQYGIAIGERQTIPNWPILLWGNGGDVVKDGKSFLASEESLGALKLWGPLVRDEKVSPYGLTGAEADKLFETGKAAMSITGPWMVNGFLAANLNFDVAPIPAGPAGPVTLADTVVIVVNAKTQAKDAAINFVKYWNSKESQLYFSSQTGFPPARLDLVGDPELAKNPWSAKFASVAPYSRFYLGGQEKYVQIDNEVFVPMIQSITQGVMSVEDAVAAADDVLNELLK